MKIIESILPITTSNQGMEQFFRNRKYGGEVTTATVFSRKGAEHHHLDKNSGSNFMKNRNLNSKSALMPSNLNRSSSILRNSTEQRNHSRQDDEM
jgi:hypothetical protein